ncbi:hypothetical protein ACKKBG_A08170 [Auxenochlorella protothecoides x Auxenochlorella symbiontica]
MWRAKCEWVVRLSPLLLLVSHTLHHPSRSPCHVVYTEYRPTPLEHYVFPAGGDGLYMVVDSRGNFREDNFGKAVAVVNDVTGDSVSASKRQKKGAGGGDPTLVIGDGKEKSDVAKLVKMVMEKNFDPIIIFSFSKKECESLAMQMVAMDLNTAEEKQMIEAVFTSAIDVLSIEDQKLPQIRNLLPMLQRGFGVHHSGLLPILKEMVEILFQEGLIKALFATETFSTGLNMPAKTVCFTHVRKFDGGSFRWVSSGEYIQMSGRAGRRGLDDKGLVVMMLDARMEPSVAKQMLKGAADTLYSEFHLEYNMLLNLMRVEGVEPEELMHRSYRQFQTERLLPALQQKLRRLEGEHESFKIPDEHSIEEYLMLTDQLVAFQQQMRSLLYQPKYALPFLQPGRLVQISLAAEATDETDGSAEGPTHAPVWGAIINFQKALSKSKRGKDDEKPRSKDKEFLIDILVNIRKVSAQQSHRRPIPIPANSDGEALIMAVTLGEIAAISSLRVYIPQDLRSVQSRQNAIKALVEVERRFKGSAPLLDPVKDINVKEDVYRKLERKLEHVEHLLSKNPLSGSSTLATILEPYKQKQACLAEMKALKKEIKGAQSLVMLDELKQRKRILKRLEFISKEGVVTLKGRVASEISTGDELVLTELVFSGFFKELSTPQLCAILSCFVWQDRSESKSKVPQGLEAPFAAVRDMARRICKVANDCQMPMDMDEYVESFSPSLMDTVGAWAQGARFVDVLKSSGILEGSIVRAIRRLEELLRQLGNALRTIGELELAAKCDKAIESIKRDIVFAASLYL